MAAVPLNDTLVLGQHEWFRRLRTGKKAVASLTGFLFTTAPSPGPEDKRKTKQVEIERSQTHTVSAASIVTDRRQQQKGSWYIAAINNS